MNVQPWLSAPGSSRSVDTTLKCESQPIFTLLLSVNTASVTHTVASVCLQYCIGGGGYFYTDQLEDASLAASTLQIEDEEPTHTEAIRDDEMSQNLTRTNFEQLEKLSNRSRYVARSCKEIQDRYNEHEAGGGWTLVASVHENSIYGRCTVGDRWSSQQGNNANLPDGDGNWSNRNTFGAAEGATSDDFKNPGYYEIRAEDMSVWHVPNNFPLEHWNLAAILRYHTETTSSACMEETSFRCSRYNVDSPGNRGPAIPIVYDHGDKESTKMLYGPNPRGEFEPGFITFRAINNERAAMVLLRGQAETPGPENMTLLALHTMCTLNPKGSCSGSSSLGRWSRCHHSCRGVVSSSLSVMSPGPVQRAMPGSFSVVSLGRPLGSVLRPLLLQRTTVSRQEHSAGHLSNGEQLFSLLPDQRWMDRRKDGKVLGSYILDGDLLQEIRILAARVTRDDAFPSEPITEPGQCAEATESLQHAVVYVLQSVGGQDQLIDPGGSFKCPLLYVSDTLRQLFEDPCRLEHSEFIVVQTPKNREEKRWSETKRENNRTNGDRRGGGRRSSPPWCPHSGTSLGRPSRRSSPLQAYCGNLQYLITITITTSPSALIVQESNPSVY
ncbi:hypothetical protein F7725_005460 [Dissostichus mawsoni]|uniref:Uncharacterized protein n=1 Tax=Dissostichus mawsoni TaxID=36200 RepID=A0A7J5YRM3_DISMA|nr:hypothetical protein F7725_005460 [Dissostichus mawsoni]